MNTSIADILMHKVDPYEYTSPVDKSKILLWENNYGLILNQKWTDSENFIQQLVKQPAVIFEDKNRLDNYVLSLIDEVDDINHNVHGLMSICCFRNRRGCNGVIVHPSQKDVLSNLYPNYEFDRCTFTSEELNVKECIAFYKGRDFWDSFGNYTELADGRVLAVFQETSTTPFYPHYKTGIMFVKSNSLVEFNK